MATAAQSHKPQKGRPSDTNGTGERTASNPASSCAPEPRRLVRRSSAANLPPVFRLTIPLETRKDLLT